MKICGIQKLTLLDYPGRLACTIFLGGCNLRCPFCHNGSLVIGGSTEGIISQEDFFDFLKSRQGRLDGVCVSGGEPTLHPQLPLLLGRIKSEGFAVKLDTNGTNPEMLSLLIADGLVDYVAMDIKNSLEKYESTAGMNSKFEIQNSKLIDSVRQSAKILMKGAVDFEFRTTLVKELHTADDLEAIGRWLWGEEKYFLQSYRDEGDLLVGGFTPPSAEELQEYLTILRRYIPNAQIR